MKKKILFLVFLVIASVFIYNFYNAPSEKVNSAVPPPPGSNDFLIGCINSSTLINSYYDELGINFTHAYVDTEPPDSNNPRVDPQKHTPSCKWWGTQQSDWEYLYDDVPVSKIHSKLSEVTNAQKRGKLLWQRPKIEWLAYGQSSIYQAEWLHPVNHDYWFYSFYTSSGETVRDFDFNNGDSVLYCGLPTEGARYVLKGLRANTEQCNKNEGGTINQWQYDNECRWFIKPRIRIPENYPATHYETPICSIKIIKEDGTPFKEVILRGKNFLDENNNYDGSYIEEYLRLADTDSLAVQGAWGINWPYCSRGNNSFESYWHKADVQVYWYDNCDMWIDYVKVENDVADKLLKGYYDDPAHPENQWIKQEVEAITNSSAPDAVYAFYVELVEFNHLPCIAYLNQKIKQYSNNTIGFTCDLLAMYQYHMPEDKKGEIVTTDKIKGMWYNKVQPLQIFLGDPYTLNCMPVEGCIQEPPGQPPPQFSEIPYTLPVTDNDTILAIDVSPETYDAWLQGVLDTVCGWFVNGGYLAGYPNRYDFPGVFMYLMKHGHEISKECDIPFIAMLQAHQWSGILPNGRIGEMDREPTTQEFNLLTNLAIAYGARGIIYWEYISHENNTLCNHNLGILNPNPNLTPRLENLYGQKKWDSTKAVFSRINDKWGSTLMSFTNADRQSYIYRLENERNAMYQNSYISDLFTYKISTAPPSNCYEDFPQNDYPPSGCVGECKEDRFLQVSVFKKPPTVRNELYFMLVNRRCSPFIDDQNEDNNGGRRYIRIRFVSNHSELQNYNNWKITEIGNDAWDGIEFNKMAGTVLELGWFQPSEGRLYKMEPVLKTGGNLVADEYIESGEEFTCEDTVWTNGYNLTIENGVTIHFSDSAKFVVEGGTFQLGTPDYQGPLGTEMDGSWKGFEFVEANVKIYNTNFSGLANDSISMLTMIDCPLVDLRNNTFSLGTGSNKGAIDIAYSGSYQSGVTDNVYIGSNTFGNSSTALPYIKVMAYSGFTTPVIIEENGFTGLSTALFLSNIQGGAIKSNTFTGFNRSITALSSSLDIYDNTINSTTGIYGLEALSGTELKMSYAGGVLVGGRNYITNSGTSSYNIYLEDSYFLMDEGENIFDIGDDSYHLYGWFPESYNEDYLETENCFKVENSAVDPPIEYVTLGEQGYQITDFVFTPYLTGCTQGGEGDMMVINLGNDIYDTLMYVGEGQGGSEKSEVRGLKSESRNTIITPKSVYDSISISMRYRNYANVKSLCLYLLNTYPDSVQSLGALSKLYLAVSKTDTTTQGITDLITLYENLILNHSNNVSLVKRCNYYVQKCKVLLHQYSSALSGFQQIINNNPASYEGLVARWDYMATSLMMQGQGGSEYGVFQPRWNGVNVVDALQKEDGDDDRSPFTREERKQIKQTVTTALEVSRYTEQKREKILTELSTRGDENATRQLKVLKSLEQTVKTEKPKSIAEHLKIVAGDIQKVFVNPNAGKNSNTIFIPQEFNLSQNYPNPFNPVTKINYDIPKNSMVKIIIYDILGREVMKLVNNEFKQPGRYVVEFNGTNLASGVYFYRIEVRQAGSSTVDFVNSKKMVLVK